MKKTLLLPIIVSFCFSYCTELQAQRNKKNPEAFNFELRAQTPFMFDWDSFGGQVAPLKFEDKGFGLHLGLGYRVNTTFNIKLFGEFDYLLNNPDIFINPKDKDPTYTVNTHDYFSFRNADFEQNRIILGYAANNQTFTDGSYLNAGDPLKSVIGTHYSGGGNYRTIKIGIEFQQDILPGRKICPIVAMAPYLLFLHQDALQVSIDKGYNPRYYFHTYYDTGEYDPQEYYTDNWNAEELVNGVVDDDWYTNKTSIDAGNLQSSFPWTTSTYNTLGAGIQSTFGFKFWQILTLSGNINTFFVPRYITPEDKGNFAKSSSPFGVIGVSIVPQLGVHIPISYKVPKNQ